MDQITALRLAVLANGYSPIRNRDKRTFFEGWPSAEIDEAEIARWSRMTRDKATGIRVENGLAVIDIDIDDQKVVDDIANAILDLVPELDNAEHLLVRRGKGAKEAWFVRTDELFGRIHSRAWCKPGTVPDDGTYRVECFGGASPRQFGSFGPHTIGDDGTATVSYRWADEGPDTVPQRQLPLLTKSQFFAICDRVEEILIDAGWHLHERSTKGEDHASRVYDLTDDMQFDLDTGDRVSLQSLRELAQALRDDGLRCSASWLEGPSAVNTSRCIVGLTRSGHVAIWESASSVTHVEAAAEPRGYSVEVNRMAERLAELADKRRNKVAKSDGAQAAAAKLLQTHAFCPSQPQLCIVPVWTEDVAAGFTMPMFRTTYIPNCDVEVGPRGGEKKINPVDLWVASEQRLTVGGVRMRPDQPRPTFSEGGQLWVNAYAPPAHDAVGGDARPGLALLAHLLPDRAERAWFTQWLAFKVRHPHIPGPAVVMVAREFGTGRGTLAKLMSALFGPAYVYELPFESFTGRTYQAQYNEWAASSLVVCVNESSEADGSVYQTKRNSYEHLKEIVDPAAGRMREIRVKGRSNYRAIACASYLIATNHEDALQIPEHDRRFAVLSNGLKMDQGQAETLHRWMQDEANVAAFHGWLHSVDIADYSPFAMPPKTEAKSAMVDASKSDFDKAVEGALASLQSPVFVVEQMPALVSRVATQDGLELPNVPADKFRSMIRRAVARACHKVGERGGQNERMSIEAKRYYVWARTRQAAREWTMVDAEDLREAVLKNGSPGNSGLPGNLSLMPVRR